MAPEADEKLWSLHGVIDPTAENGDHDGRELCYGVASHLALSGHLRRRVERRFTERWADMAEERVVGSRSRFEWT